MIHYDSTDNDFYVFPKLCIIHFDADRIERECDNDRVYYSNIFRIAKISDSLTSYTRYYDICAIFLNAKVLQSFQLAQNTCKFDGAFISTSIKYGNHQFSMTKYYRNTRCVKTSIQLTTRIALNYAQFHTYSQFQIYSHGSPINDRTLKDYTSWFVERCNFHNVYVPDLNLPICVEELAN